MAGNGRNGSKKFYVVKAGEGKVQKLTTVQQIDQITKWVEENKHRLRGVCLCFEFEVEGDGESLGLRTTEMRYRDIQYMLMDALLKTWAVTRGGT